MPTGYSIWRNIGFVATDSSSHFLGGFWSGTGLQRQFQYLTAQTVVTGGVATSYATISINMLVPAIDNLPVYLSSSFVPATAGNALSLKGPNQTNASAISTGQVATVAVTSLLRIFAQLASPSFTLNKFNYKVSNASDAATISVWGYDYTV